MRTRRAIVPERIHIDQLNLDLRGFPREIAESVARRVGPELVRALSVALADRSAVPTNVQARPASDPRALAAGIAHRVAARIIRGAD